jgi:hypothetical protein
MYRLKSDEILKRRRPGGFVCCSGCVIQIQKKEAYWLHVAMLGNTAIEEAGVIATQIRNV